MDIDCRSGAAGWRALAAGLARTLLALGTGMLLAAPSPAAPPGAPRDIVIMLDNSGSMRATDPDFLIRAAVRSFLQGLHGDDRVAIVSFDQRVNLLLPLTPLNEETRDRFLASLDAIDYSGRLTNSPAALERSLYALRTTGRNGAQKSIVFMTDGIVDVAPEGPDDGDIEKVRWMKSTLADEASDSLVRIFGIAFTDNADFELIQTLSRRTGGEYYRAHTMAEMDGVLQELRERLSADPGAPVRVAAGPPAAPAPGPFLPPPPPAADLPTAHGMVVLPEAEARDAPRPELPALDLPRVEPPVANVADTATPVPGDADTAGMTPAGSDAVPGPAGAVPGAVPPGDALPASPALPLPPAPAPPPPPDDSRLLSIAALSGAAALLALVALLMVLARRRAAVAGAVPQATDPLMPKAYLNDVDGASEQQKYSLDARPTIVGRLMGLDPDAAQYIVIDETTVGRRHALLEYKEHSFWIADQNSVNGTFVNNARIETPTRLKHGDRLRFHKHEFEFLVLDMFETDRTLMSDTVFSDLPSDPVHALDDGDHQTIVRAGESHPPGRAASAEDTTSR